MHFYWLKNGCKAIAKMKVIKIPLWSIQSACPQNLQYPPSLYSPSPPPPLIVVNLMEKQIQQQGEILSLLTTLVRTNSAHLQSRSMPESPPGKQYGNEDAGGSGEDILLWDPDNKQHAPLPSRSVSLVGHLGKSDGSDALLHQSDTRQYATPTSRNASRMGGLGEGDTLPQRPWTRQHAPTTRQHAPTTRQHATPTSSVTLIGDLGESDESIPIDVLPCQSDTSGSASWMKESDTLPQHPGTGQNATPTSRNASWMGGLGEGNSLLERPGTRQHVTPTSRNASWIGGVGEGNLLPGTRQHVSRTSTNSSWIGGVGEGNPLLERPGTRQHVTRTSTNSSWIGGVGEGNHLPERPETRQHVTPTSRNASWIGGVGEGNPLPERPGTRQHVTPTSRNASWIGGVGEGNSLPERPGTRQHATPTSWNASCQREGDTQPERPGTRQHVTPTSRNVNWMGGLKEGVESAHIARQSETRWHAPLPSMSRRGSTPFSGHASWKDTSTSREDTDTSFLDSLSPSQDCIILDNFSWDDTAGDDSDYATGTTWDDAVDHHNGISSATPVMSPAIPLSFETPPIPPPFETPPKLTSVEQVLKDYPGTDTEGLKRLALALARDAIFGRKKCQRAASVGGRGRKY